MFFPLVFWLDLVPSSFSDSRFLMFRYSICWNLSYVVWIVVYIALRFVTSNLVGITDGRLEEARPKFVSRQFIASP